MDEWRRGREAERRAKAASKREQMRVLLEQTQVDLDNIKDECFQVLQTRQQHPDFTQAQDTIRDMEKAYREEVKIAEKELELAGSEGSDFKDLIGDLRKAFDLVRRQRLQDFLDAANQDIEARSAEIEQTKTDNEGKNYLSKKSVPKVLKLEDFGLSQAMIKADNLDKIMARIDLMEDKRIPAQMYKFAESLAKLTLNYAAMAAVALFVGVPVGLYKGAVGAKKSLEKNGPIAANYLKQQAKQKAAEAKASAKEGYAKAKVAAKEGATGAYRYAEDTIAEMMADSTPHEVQAKQRVEEAQAKVDRLKGKVREADLVVRQGMASQAANIKDFDPKWVSDNVALMKDFGRQLEAAKVELKTAKDDLKAVKDAARQVRQEERDARRAAADEQAGVAGPEQPFGGPHDDQDDEQLRNAAETASGMVLTDEGEPGVAGPEQPFGGPHDDQDDEQLRNAAETASGMVLTGEDEDEDDELLFGKELPDLEQVHNTDQDREERREAERKAEAVQQRMKKDVREGRQDPEEEQSNKPPTPGAAAAD